MPYNVWGPTGSPYTDLEKIKKIQNFLRKSRFSWLLAKFFSMGRTSNHAQSM